MNKPDPSQLARFIDPCENTKACAAQIQKNCKSILAGHTQPSAKAWGYASVAECVADVRQVPATCQPRNAHLVCSAARREPAPLYGTYAQCMQTYHASNQPLDLKDYACRVNRSTDSKAAYAACMQANSLFQVPPPVPGNCANPLSGPY
jgi:hypothetical protein